MLGDLNEAAPVEELKLVKFNLLPLKSLQIKVKSNNQLTTTKNLKKNIFKNNKKLKNLNNIQINSSINMNPSKMFYLPKIQN